MNQGKLLSFRSWNMPQVYREIIIVVQVKNPFHVQFWNKIIEEIITLKIFIVSAISRTWICCKV